MKKDYYRILGVSKDADKDEIKQAYRQLAKKFHPDMNHSPGADEIFIEISEAYEFLINQPARTGEKEVTAEEVYEHYKEEVREKARQQAQMKYEKFINEHEAFKASGVYDVFLLMKIVLRIFMVIVTITLFSLPVALSIIEWYLIFSALIFWPFAIILGMFIYEKRKNYFIPGKFYYNLKKIKEYLNETDEKSEYECFYCRNRKADSKPYKIYLLKIKDIKLDNVGPLYHNAHYKRTHKTVRIPRSKHALKLHVVSSVIKFICVFILPFIIPVNSFLWRIAIGVFTGLILSNVFLFLLRTRSKTTYLLYPAMIIKILVWLLILIIFTDFSGGFFRLQTSEFIKPAFGILFFFDPFIEMILKSINNFRLLKPIKKEYRELDIYFEKKYQYYLDIPFWTIIYPLFKWIFG